MFDSINRKQLLGTLLTDLKLDCSSAAAASDNLDRCNSSNSPGYTSIHHQPNRGRVMIYNILWVKWTLRAVNVMGNTHWVYFEAEKVLNAEQSQTGLIGDYPRLRRTLVSPIKLCISLSPITHVILILKLHDDEWHKRTLWINAWSGGKLQSSLRKLELMRWS